MKYALRLFIFFVFLSPVIAVYFTPSNKTFFIFLAFFFPLIIGVFLNTFFFNVLEYFNLQVKKKDDEVQKQLDNLEGNDKNKSFDTDSSNE